MDTVFFSQITRSSVKSRNNLYDLLDITPATPATVNPLKESDFNFQPQNNKFYILKKKNKLKVKTVREIRVCFEKDILFDLPQELDKQQNVLLRKIRSGSIQDGKTKKIATNILNSETPVTRQAWQMLMNINPEDQAYSSQFVIWNGACIQVNGSRGGKTKFLCNRDLGKFSTNYFKNDSHKKKMYSKKRNLLRNSLSINFKPGPLTRKKHLDISYQKYNVGNIEIINLPKIGLEVIPMYGTNLDPSISNLVTNFREVDGTISSKWAEFAVSMVGSVRSQNMNQANKNSKTTFYLDYKYNQQRTLMRRNLGNEIKQYPLLTQKSNISVDNSTLLPEIKVILDKILDAVEVHVDEDKFYTGIEEPRTISENIPFVSNIMTKEKSKRKYCELDRLDVKVINLMENSNISKSECHNAFCNLGCLCNSLQCLYNFRNHCGRVECIFKCHCDFSKYNAIDIKESDCSEFLPGLLNLENCNYTLSKEEQKFRQTVIVTDNNSILLKSKRRNWKSSTKYADFYSNMRLKSDLKKEMSLAVVDIKLNLENIEPWCMVHNLYKCFCKGKFVSNMINEKLENEEGHLVEISKEPKKTDIDGENVNDKNNDRYISTRKMQCNTDPYDEKNVDNVTFVSYEQLGSSCARTVAFKERNYSNKYYSVIHKKIKELETNDSYIQKRLLSIINQSICTNQDDTRNATNHDIVKKTNSELKLTTEVTNTEHTQPEKVSHVENTICATSSMHPEMNLCENDSSQLKLLSEVDLKCSSATKEVVNANSISELKIFDILKNQPILNRPQLVTWVESGYKHYKQRLKMGRQFILEPPKKGKVTLYTWDFILSRYSERKNHFLVSKQAPYRIFIAVHNLTAFSQHCINIDEIRFAELNKYPVTVKNLLTSSKGPKHSFCLLFGLSQCWELVSSVVKTKDNLNDSLECENECSRDSFSDGLSFDSDFTNEALVSVSIQDQKVKDSSKWFVMTIENDFSEIQFYNHNFFVKHESIMQSIEVAKKTGKTVRLSPLRSADKNSEPQFGIYAVPTAQDNCVFIGPYEPDENLGIETINTAGIDKKMKRTRGVWVKTNKIDNMKVVNNPLSFISLDKVNRTDMLPIVNDTTDEPKVISDPDSHPSISSQSKEMVTENSNNKGVKVITIRKTNGNYKLASKPAVDNAVQNVSSSKNQSKNTLPKISILRKNINAMPFIIASDSQHKSLIKNDMTVPFLCNLDTNAPQFPQILPQLKKPVAEVAPQIKIAAIYSAADFDKQINAARTESGMLILKPEEINQRLGVKKVSTISNDKPTAIVTSGNNDVMDVEDFLDSAVVCEGDDDPYLISDDESEKIRQVWIKCKNIPEIGMISAKINKEGDVSFEFPGFKFTEFYQKDVAFRKINQVLTRKVCIPRNMTMEWHIVDTMEEQNHLLKAEDLGPNVVLTKKGLMKKTSLLKILEKQPVEAVATSASLDNIIEKTETNQVNLEMCEENTNLSTSVDDDLLRKTKVYKDAIIKSISDSNIEQVESDQVGSKICSDNAESSVKVDDSLFRNTKVYKDAIVKSIAEATSDDRKRLTRTLEDMLFSSSNLI